MLPIVVWEIGTRDLKKGVEFYSKLFGWEFEMPPDSHHPAVVRFASGPMGLLSEIPDLHSLLWVEVPNIVATLKRAKELGCPIGEMEVDPDDPEISEGMLYLPGGVPIGIVAAEEGIEEEVAPDLTPIHALCYYGICVPEMIATASILKELFDWEAQFEQGFTGYARIDSGQPIRGALEHLEPSGTLLTFRLAGIDATLEKAVELGGQIFMRRTALPNDGGFFGVLVSPDNVHIGLWEKF